MQDTLLPLLPAMPLGLLLLLLLLSVKSGARTLRQLLFHSPQPCPL